MTTKEKPRSAKAPPAPVMVLALPASANALLGKKQLCYALGVGLRKFQEMLATGEFPKADTRLGKLPRWHVKTLNEWIDRRCGRGA
jgi:predicted DNA-binding transcriptional regulator AlpA